ncbi:hypothetical protein HO133_004264 [Letharia lupina]|uniref:Uncharacterized protein n=1 Tax=Letharia lupina TaxID=560253 RepID=A0A8H6FK05_9LECA|nr:uncharacterized protein HO133_004264 [Letharia lupina]KAF6229927.1 hypothetical protein HO133_004264 [Letharia lupina]
MDLAEAESGIWESEEILGFNVYLSEISFGFDRLANEGETAVFKLEGGTEDLFPEIMSQYPIWVVDEEQREISFDWRAMFSQFCADDELKNYMKHNLSNERTGPIKARKLEDKTDRGEADIFDGVSSSQRG